MPIFHRVEEEIRQGRQYKVGERRKLLQEHPELKRRIDTDSLRQIVNYADFKCVADCSIATDMAIEGSDVDGGLVITDNGLTPEKRLEFIAELRRQGFSTYDISEVEKAEKEWDDFQAKYKGNTPIPTEDWDTLKELSKNKVETQCGLIRFFSKTDIQKFEDGDFPDAEIKKVYYLGYSIK